MFFSSIQLDNLSTLINSLRLAQRAEIIKEGGRNIIDQLYVDPLPNDAIFKQVIQDDTVFLIGRKGTGKSTVFAKAQEYFRHQNEEVSAYIDVKTLYGKSIAQDIKVGNDDENVQKLILFQNFITTILSELIKELEINLENKNLLGKLLNKSKFGQVKIQLEKLHQFINEPSFLDVSLKLNSNSTNTDKRGEESQYEETSSADINISPEAFKFGISGKESSAEKLLRSEERVKSFSSILLRHFSIKDYMEKISEQLKIVGIRKVHVFLDDFSEIEFEAQQIFVNTILAPLNNWSDKFFRFKVAAYPKRIFYGDIEKGKITEIQLDYYDTYKVKALPELEEKAIDFLDRLLTRRFDFYLKTKPEIIFQIDSTNSWEGYKKLLFQCSMNIPRVLGHILFYCYNSAIIYQKKITKSLIEESTQKYYEKQVAYYFEKTNYLAEAFDETLDRYSQQILMDKIVGRAKELKNRLASEQSEMFVDLPRSLIPTSHFYIKKEYEKFFHTLELNYFLSKYYEQADRDGIMISIYAINYGLCKANNIIFGRPDGDAKYRKYYISRFFDYNNLLEEYLLGQVEYVCTKCNNKYDFKEYETLTKIDMLCYKGCKEKGFIEEKYMFNNIPVFQRVKKENLLTEVELDILHTLNEAKDRDLYASIIAQELDCSYQLVGLRASKLQEKELLNKSNKVVDNTSRKVYQITDKAEKIYFSNSNDNVDS